MKKLSYLTLVGIVILLVMSLAPTLSFATEYTWGMNNLDYLWSDQYGVDFDYFKYRTATDIYEFEDEGGLGSNWVILGQGEYDFILTSETYCVGVLAYETLAQDRDASKDPNPTQGWAYAYYATLKTDEIADCDNLITYYDPQFPDDDPDPYDGGDARPGLLFLHGDGGRGGFGLAALVAHYTSVEERPSFVLAISAPGQGWDCLARTTPRECQIYPGDQYSHGDSMSDNDYVDGFDGNVATNPHPDYSMLWGYALSSMRAISFFKNVLIDDVSNHYSLNLVSDKLVLGGWSGGGVTALIVNGVDTDDNQDPRLDGTFTYSASAGFLENLKVPGSWTAINLKSRAGEIWENDESFDCTGWRNNPGQYEEYVRRGCELLDYMEPNYFDAQTPVFLALGAQEEQFSYNAYKTTYEALEANPNEQPYYRLYQADMDHQYYYFYFDLLMAPEQNLESITHFNFLNFDDMNFGINRVWSSIGGFFNAMIDSNVDYPPPPDMQAISYNYNSQTEVATYAICAEHTTANGDVYMNITIDNFFHILPACTTGGSWDDVNTYTIDLDTTTHEFKSECRNDSYNDLRHYSRCPDSEVSWSRVLKAEYDSGDYCVYLEFTNVEDEEDLPDAVAAWAEFHDDLTIVGETKRAVNASDIVTYPTQSDIEPCVRNKSAGRNVLMDMIDPMEVFETAPAQCVDMVFDSTEELLDGTVFSLEETNVIIQNGGTLDIGTGQMRIVTNCDVVIESGGLIDATGGNAGTVEIYARNIVVESGGDVDASGTTNGGTIKFYSLIDTEIDGELTVVGSGSSGGEIDLSGSGNLFVTGNLDAQGVSNGGEVTTAFTQNSEFNGAFVRVKSTGFWGWGGDIDITTGFELSTDANAEFRAGAVLWTRRGTISLTYCEKDIDQGTYFYPPNPSENQICPYTMEAGSILSDTTWTAANSPYVVMDDIFVRCGTLTIQPGVEVYFVSGTSLYVGNKSPGCISIGDPTLVADGTASSLIKFTSIEYHPQPGDWGGIALLSDSDDNVLDNAIVSYGGDPSFGQSVEVLNDSTTITESAIAYSGSTGVYYDDALVDVEDCWIHDNEGSGVKVNGVPANSSLLRVLMENNLIGAEVVNGSLLSIDACTITGNSELGVDVQGSRLTMTGTDVIGNSYDGVDIDGSVFSAGILIQSDALDSNVISDDNAIHGNMPDSSAVDYEYEFINFSSYGILAEDNWWDATTSGAIALLIYDYFDDDSCGVVDYTPWLYTAP